MYDHWGSQFQSVQQVESLKVEPLQLKLLLVESQQNDFLQAESLQVESLQVESLQVGSLQVESLGEPSTKKNRLNYDIVQIKLQTHPPPLIWTK